MKNKTTDYELNGLIEISYENQDVDTDRGILRDRSFVLVFQDGTLTISEEDFMKLHLEVNKFTRGDE